MNDLHRELAPVTSAGWNAIEDEARRVLRVHLAGRRLAAFEGPHGWQHSAVDLGRAEPVKNAPAGVQLRARQTRPLLELRVAFAVERTELEAVERGATEVDLGPVVEAARRLAAAEDRILFEGCPVAGVPGLLAAAEPEPVPFPADRGRVPGAVAQALDRLRRAGVEGPYALALGPAEFAAVSGAAEEGYPLLRHLRSLVDGPIVWAPTLGGGLVASLRGGDFALVCGRDASIGYEGHDERRVRLYLEESIGVRLSGPEAVVPMPATASRRR
jgi:uncharacterized linocin/CFP29 family protein